MYLKSSIQTSSIDYNIRKYPYNIKHIKQFTNSINQNIITDTKTPIHQNNLGTDLFLSQI